MYASLQQSDDEEQVLQEDAEGEKDSTHDLAKVMLDLQEKVTLMSKELKEYKNETDEKLQRTEEEQKKTEEQVALITRVIDKSEEDVQDPIAPISEDGPRTSGIDEDTFSLMMTSKVCSLGWVLGLGTFVFQMTLIVIIMKRDFQLSKGSTPFDAPIRVTNEVRIGQFFAVILSLLSQQDILTAIDSLIVFRSSSPANKDSGFYRLLVDDNDAADELEGGRRNECTTWFLRAILPNCLKLMQGISVLFVALVVIIQSDDLIVLLRDFTALYFLSEIDNIFFKVASQGYFGENLKARTEKVKHVEYVEVNDMEALTTTTTSCVVEHFKRQLKIFFLFALASTMFYVLIYVVRGQLSGEFARKKYPDCDFKKANKSPLRIGDNNCDGVLNNIDCGYDGGDCIEFNLRYSGCRVENINLLGDGFCNGGINNAIGCFRDGGDCDVCPNVPNSEKDTRAIATGDFDNDFDLDIIVGNCGFSNQLLLNNGDGSFGNVIDLPGGNYNQCTTSIVAADLDRDGYIDIIVGRQSFEDSAGRDLGFNRTNTILWNNGDATFNEEVILNSDMVDTQVIQVVDLNNDSFPEIIFGNSNTSANSILYNRGNRAFVQQDFPNSADYDTRSIIVIVDGQNETNQNIVFGNFDGPIVSYNKATSGDDINFDGPKFDNFGTRDEKKTIAMATFTTVPGYTFTVALNEGGDHETFSTKEGQVYSLLDDENMKDARCINSTVDLNNEGSVALVTGHGNGTSNHVFFLSTERDRPPIKSSIELPCTSSMNTNAIALADLDNDGKMDIIMGNSMQKNQVLLNFLGDGMTYKQSGNDLQNVWLSDYPDCMQVEYLFLIGNGDCNNKYPYNTEACGYDGGDCIEFNAKYPNCRAEDTYNIGDGRCDNLAPYNTESCGYDGGDCIEFNAKGYPDCAAEVAWYIGDGYCHNWFPYNTESCGYDGGDCL